MSIKDSKSDLILTTTGIRTGPTALRTSIKSPAKAK